MADEIISESAPQTPTEPQPTPQPEPAPIPTENPIPEPEQAPVSPQEPMEQAPIPPTESAPAPVPSGPAEAPPNPEEATPVKDDISANEPLNQSSATAQNPTEPQKTETNPEQNPVPETPENSPKPESKTETAQMAGNEPFDKTQDKPIDLAEEIKIKQRQENLKLANETRLEKKWKKIDAILNLFAERQTVTNDEVEKLLHVSDATATRYLEQLEKEGKIKQVGKTGKGVVYEKI